MACPGTFQEPTNEATRNVVSNNHRPVAGIAFCVTALLAFATQDSIVKGLSERNPILEILALRSALVLVILVPIGLHLYGVRILKTARPKPMLARGVLAFFAFTSYYLALSRTPLADAAAVYMTAPLFVTILSIPMLGEHVGWHRWMAVCLGFLAVLVMLNPGSALFRLEAAVPLFSALCYSMIPIINRKIGLSEHAITMVLYTTVTFLALCLIASSVIHALPDAPGNGGLVENLLQRWLLPTPVDLALMGVSGVIFTVAILCITQAYRIAIVSAIAPFEYTYLVWASLLGYFVFGDIPGIRTIAGGLAVVACGCYVLYRERTRSAA